MTRGDGTTALVRGEFLLFLLEGLPREVDVERLCRDAGIPYTSLQEPLCRIPIEPAAAVLRQAERLCADPLLGLHVAQHRGAGCVLRYLTISEATLGHGLATLCRFQALLLSGHDLSLTQSDSKFTLTIWPGLDASCRHVIEAWLAVLIREARDATGNPHCIGEIHLRHAAVTPPTRYEEALACRVRFGQPSNAVVFAAASMDACLRKHNAAIAAALGEAAELELEIQSSPTFEQRVALLLRARLRLQESCDRSAIARRLVLTSRTLQRRLEAEGVSFNDVAGRVRRALALQLTADSELGLAAVASQCGFSSLSAFNKAFKRWTGFPPSAFRRSQVHRI